MLLLCFTSHFLFLSFFSLFEWPLVVVLEFSSSIRMLKARCLFLDDFVASSAPFRQGCFMNRPWLLTYWMALRHFCLCRSGLAIDCIFIKTMGLLSPDHALLLHSLCSLRFMQVQCLLLLLPFPGQGCSLYCSTCGWQSQANGAFSPSCLHYRRFHFYVLCLECRYMPNWRMRYQKKGFSSTEQKKKK